MEVEHIVGLIISAIAIIGLLVLLFIAIIDDEKKYQDKKRYYDSFIEFNNIRKDYYQRCIAYLNELEGD